MTPEERIEKLELENKVMRQWINHRIQLDREGFFPSYLFHNEHDCEHCTRLVATFHPEIQWRGWAA